MKTLIAIASTSFRFFTIKNTFLIFFLSSIYTFGQTIYVSPEGKSANSGAITSPVTLEKAFQMAEDDTSILEISIRGGLYNLSSTINLTEKHSRTKENPLVVQAYQDETVTLTSSRIVASTLFREVSGNELNRLPALSHKHVKVANLSGKNYFENLQEGKYGAISWNGHLLPVAEFPNKGFAYIGTINDQGSVVSANVTGTYEKPVGGRFFPRDACGLDFELLKEEVENTQDILVRGYFHNDWWYDTNFLAKSDPERGELSLLKKNRYGLVHKHQFPRRFKLIHAISQLDRPGEWYYDKNTEQLFIWPVQPISNDSAISQINEITLISGENVKNMHFKNIDFNGFGPAGAYFAHSDFITFSGCEFSSSQDGRGLNFQRCADITVESSTFFDLFNAFTITGRPDNLYDLVQENNTAINNHIYNCRIRGYGLTAIHGVGGRFTNNLIHDINGGIVFTGNDHVIEYNEIYDGGFGMGDWNSIYFPGSIHYFGNVIKNNFFHHFQEIPGAHPISAVRGDDGCSGLSMLNNIFYKTGYCGADGSGPDIHVEGNVNIGVKWAWTSFQRPSNSISREAYLQEQIAIHEDMQKRIADGELDPQTKDNFLGRAELVFGKDGWKNNQAWIDKYPNFKDLFSLTAHANPWTSAYCTMKNNYVTSDARAPYINYHGSNPRGTIEQIRTSMANTSEIELAEVLDLNTAFEDASTLDFRFKNSFTPMDGFVKWDFNKVGLFVDEYRKTTPNKAEYRKKVKAKYEGKPSHSGSLNLTNINLRYADPVYLQDLTSSGNTIPGIIEAEDYDEGCEGITYHDSDSSNSGNVYRRNGVDIETTNDSEGTYHLASTASGEWIEYTLYVEKTDNYLLDVRVSSPNSDGNFKLLFNDEEKVDVTINSTGSYSNWETIRKNVFLHKGKYKMRLDVKKGGFNLNHMAFYSIASFEGDNFTIRAVGETCPDKDNGVLAVRVKNEADYTLVFDGKETPFKNSAIIQNVKSGVYDVCIKNALINKTTCYEITFPESNPLAAQAKVDSDKVDIDIDQGTPPYNVLINGESVMTTNETSFSVAVKKGDVLKVKTEKDCEGTFEKKIESDEVLAYPKPAKDYINLILPNSEQKVKVSIFDMQSKLVLSKEYSNSTGRIQLDIRSLSAGIYTAKVQSNDGPVRIQIIKE